MTDKNAIEWPVVFSVRSYMSRVATAMDTEAEKADANKFIKLEMERLQRVNPNAAKQLCDGKLDEIPNAALRAVLEEFAWMWLAGQNIIDRKRHERRNRAA